ncbi:MAG: MEKHLA domain-containing protein [Nitrospirae bacterium]|nr:MAG: MEKHLA domain-containing protein [Nitrospirota bacterium]
MTPKEWWMESAKIIWAQLLLDSFRRWTGRDLIERSGTVETQAARLFAAPFVVVSHGIEPDPALNYGNRIALELWEMDWEAFSRTPSRLTAEPENRAERERMLAQAATRGFIDDYRGVRISRTGRRFLVENALVWNVADETGQKQGQAATFSRWTFLTSSGRSGSG